MKQGNPDLLKHPLVISLLDYKWKKFGRFVFFLNLLIYIFFLVFLTAFGLTVLSPLEMTCAYIHLNAYLTAWVGSNSVVL